MPQDTHRKDTISAWHTYRRESLLTLLTQDSTTTFNGTDTIMTIVITDVVGSSKTYSAAAFWKYGDYVVTVVADPVSITILGACH